MDSFRIQGWGSQPESTSPHAQRDRGLVGELTRGVTQQAILAASNLRAQLHLLPPSLLGNPSPEEALREAGAVAGKRWEGVTELHVEGNTVVVSPNYAS